jgi:hypothetical protein
MEEITDTGDTHEPDGLLHESKVKISEAIDVDIQLFGVRV